MRPQGCVAPSNRLFSLLVSRALLINEIVDQIRFFSFVKVTDLEEGKF